MSNLLAWMLLVVSLSSALLGAPIARACVGRSCVEGAALPEDITYRPGLELELERPGEVPANMVAFVWRRPIAFDGGLPASQRQTRLFVNETGGRRALKFDARELHVPGSDPFDEPKLFIIEPSETLSAGSELVFEWDDFCPQGLSGRDEPRNESRTVRVVPPAAAPRELGMLIAEITRGTVEVGGGELCSSSVAAAFADLSVELSSQAKPYADLLRFELLVDGKRAQHYDLPIYLDMRRPIGSGLLGRGRERVIASCEDAVGGSFVEPGDHSVQFRAALPDGTELATQKLTVDLSCGGCSVRPAASGGGPLGLILLCAAALLLRKRRTACAGGR